MNQLIKIIEVSAMQRERAKQMMIERNRRKRLRIYLW